MELTDRIEKLIASISKDVFEKEQIFKLSFLAMLSGESIFVLGKPGIAKSMIARRMKFALKNGKIFEYLMNRFSTPEEIFGSISIKSLQEGRYRRVTDQYLPSANIAFLDEIWKSGPSILNNLLTILNEKIFRNDGIDIKVPLWLLIAASNELPEENKGLEALYDRFIIRYIARPLIKKDNFEKMLQTNISIDIDVDSMLQISDTEYNFWLSKIKTVKVPESVLEFINIFRQNLSDTTNNEAYISDRRWTKIINIMKASAYYNGRNTIDKSDWLIIPYCIWDTYEQEVEYRKVFQNCLKKNLMLDIQLRKKEINDEIQVLLSKIKAIESGVTSLKVYENLFNNKLKGQFFRLNGLTENYYFVYILKNDYIQLLNNPTISNKMRLYLSNNESDIAEIKNFYLKFKKNGQIFLLKNNIKNIKEILYVEKNINDNSQNELIELNNDLVHLKQDYNNFVDFNKNEFVRISKQRNIFLDSDFKMFLDEYKNSEKVNDAIMK